MILATERVRHLTHQQVLEATDGSRVINHSSDAEEFCDTLMVADTAIVSEDDYSPINAYACKRANRYFTWGLNEQLSSVRMSYYSSTYARVPVECTRRLLSQSAVR